MWITILPMINPHLTSPAISFPQAHSWVEMRPSFRLIPRWTRLGWTCTIAARSIPVAMRQQPEV
jgi:hypothetical protein